jgi:hypothetical protein
MVEWARLDLYRNLCGFGLGVDLVGEFRIPIAEAVGGVRKPIAERRATKVGR